MFRKFIRLLAIVSPLFVGLGATLYWLYLNDETAAHGISLRASALGLLLVAATTAVNLGLRWLRWHFLTRRFGARLLTRESFRVYFATLPLITTPFYFGEAFRGIFFRRSDPRVRGIGIKAWFAERVADAAALGVWMLWGAQYPWLAAAALVGFWGLSVWAFGTVEATKYRERASGGSWMTAAAFCSLTLAAWSLPIIGLQALLRLWGQVVSWGDASLVFGASTVGGALTGLPAGVGVSGSLAILWLEELPGAEAWLPWAIAVFRLGTVWLTVGCGLFLFWLWRKPLLAIVRGHAVDNHFDEIAAVYSDEIPAHVKERLLERKIGLMARALGRAPQELRGLDLGCGQGWYVSEMAARGYEMAGVDVSAGQVQKARQYAEKHGLTLDLAVATAAKIPFPDASFDFVYSINVLHHILDDDARRETFREIRRVLKPGGTFFLHEMNTINPLFRLYMSYIFPLINSIDEGNERWIMPQKLPPVEGATWSDSVEYFTFLPDFVPRAVLSLFAPVERWLESGTWTRRYSAHYLAYLKRNG